MNVLELCLSPGRGGLELYMARAARTLARRHRVLALIGPQPGVIRPVLDEAGVPWREWQVGLPELPLLSAWHLARLLDAEAVDVIHAHWRRDLPLAVLAKRMSRRRPRLLFFSQVKVSHGKTDPYHAYLYRHVDVLLTNSNQLREQWRERLRPEQRERVQTLYYGAEAARVLGGAEREALRKDYDLPAGVFTVGLFGQKHEGKGQLLLVEALHQLRAEGRPVHGLIVGPVTDAAYVARLRARIGELGLSEHVTELDFHPRPQDLMQLCDVVVLATWQETFGLVLIEAMSVGVAVIGSDAGGVPEIIEHGRSGLLFETRNAASLAEQVRAVHDDAGQRQRLATEGRRVAQERFSLERHYQELEAVLQAQGSRP